MSKKKRNLNKEIIALFSGQASVVTTPKLYIELTGSHSLATVLNQCVYWSNKSDCKDEWFYKDYEDWFEEIHIPERTLRRRFDSLEKSGWITTKVKKVEGINTKHVKPHMDKIIESISIMLNIECPNRPECPSGSENEQKPCTKVAPTGHIGRSEPAILAVSSYTEDYIQKKTTTVIQNPSSSFFSFSEVNSLLLLKLETDTRFDETFLEHCQWHVEKQENTNSRFQRIKGLTTILKGLQEKGECFKAKGFVDLNAKKIKAEQEALRLQAQDRLAKEKLDELQKKSANTKRTNSEQPKRLTGMWAGLLQGLTNANKGCMPT